MRLRACLAVALILSAVSCFEFTRASQQRAGSPEKQAAPAKSLALFADQAWYKGQAGKEQAFEGVVEKIERGRVVGFGRFNPFRLKMDGDTREIYVGGKRTVLDPYVGLKVRLRGKAVDLGVEGQRHREIWPAALVVLGKPDTGEAAVRVLRQTNFVNKTDRAQSTLVLRSQEAALKSLEGETAAAKVKLDDVDFTKQMVVLIKSGRTNSFGVRIVINKVSVSGDEKTATVHWTYHPYLGGAAPPAVPGNPGAVAVLDRFDGAVNFKKTVYRLPDGVPPPPSAPPRGPGRGPVRGGPVRPLGQPVLPPRPIKPVEQPKENDTGEFTKALKERLTGKADLTGFRLDVHWLRRSATVYDSGIGIWNREKQFTLQKSQIVELLKTLGKGGFAKLKSRYGGLSRPIRGPALGAPERLIGSLNVTLGKVSKGSMQLGGGEQSKALAGLIGKILDQLEEAAKEGVTATDLSDGLRKIADGRLNPITMSLLVQRIENEGRGPNGWILRVNGRQAEVQLRSKTGIAQPVRMELSEKQLGEICDMLVKNDAANLPVNLWAPDYTDFRVSIFRAKKSLQARKFARLTPTTHGEKQKNFDRIFAALDKLRQQIVKSKAQD